jgi:predicted esterase YcpF (UPF0227 family)
MLLYISGFNSTPKPWIPVTLKEQLDQNEVVYYVLKNVLSEDLKNLREIITQSQDNLILIGHSTGGFLALTLLREFDKVIAAHCINPAFNLIDALDKNPDAINFLKERSLILEIMQANADYFKSPSPVCLYQGMLDDRVDIPYNEKMMLALAGHVYRYPDLAHKFDQDGFRMILRDVRASC